MNIMIVIQIMLNKIRFDEYNGIMLNYIRFDEYNDHDSNYVELYSS